MEPLISASLGATPLLYGILRRLLGWISSVFGGYEIDMYLMWSLHPLRFIPLFFTTLWSDLAYLEVARRTEDHGLCKFSPQILFLFLARHILLSAHLIYFWWQ